MAPPDDVQPAISQRRPRSRKSIAHPPSTSSKSDIMDKENMTADIGAVLDAKGSEPAKDRPAKKSRSKSIGPGGLIGLREGAGNRRKSTLAPTVKSILKPTVPLSPLKEIPALSSTRKGKQSNPDLRSSTVGATGGQSSPDMLVDVSVPERPGQDTTTSDDHHALFTSPEVEQPSNSRDATTVALKTEAQQEEEKRAMEKKEAIERRDARRKSLANRRVSFAPEATLHTWDVVEYVQDSTTSSSSTASTRRASSMSTPSLPATPMPPSQLHDDLTEVSEPPSTPPEQVEEVQVSASPAHQRDLHQKKMRRRSSGIPPMNFNNPADEIFSSPYSGSSAAGSDDTNHTIVTNCDESDSDEASVVEGESTMMVLDEDDMTGHSIASVRSTSSTASSDRLEAALQQAAAQAGTQGIGFDEHGDQTMEMADDEITAAFQPWAKRSRSSTGGSQRPRAPAKEIPQNPFSPAFKEGTVSRASQHQDDDGPEDSEISMDMTRAVGGILKGNSDGDEMSMDMTRAIGNILPQAPRQAPRPADDVSVMGDETMDLTMAVGSIEADARSTTEEDEEMTMELTTVVGGVLSKQQPPSGSTAIVPRNETSVVDESDMDMTMVVGGILPGTSQKQPDVMEDQTMDMDVTTAMGQILPEHMRGGTRTQAKILMERETDSGQLTSSPFQEHVGLGSPSKLPVFKPTTQPAHPTGSPSPAARKTRAGARKSAAHAVPSTPRSGGKQSSTPVKKLATPSKQVTPVAARPTTPGKTPPSKNIMFRSASPKKLFKEEMRQLEVTPKPASAKRLFAQDGEDGRATPRVILQPQRRRSSGLGADKEGMGSPRVAALLDRRRSIGEDAKLFTPTQGGKERTRVLRFQDDQAMGAELEEGIQADARRKDARRTMEREADVPEREEEKDATLNLREMIESLTPKKKLKGRKSLHVGAARGILGKRPIELDEDDQETEDDSPKRLKSREDSPVKNVMLPPPPSKIETTGRNTRATRRGEVNAAGPTVTPSTTDASSINLAVTTPKDQGRFKDVEAPASAVKSADLFSHARLEDESPGQANESFEKIHLQDFLNLTSIRFMELTTTKRRHTVMPKPLPSGTEQAAPNGSEGTEATDPTSGLESCVVAGACTVPMLELYQHSCRELKKYISEGRTIVREIETDTFEENPPLFREYMSASPDVRFIMDNQFKNVKTHARLLSKAMWYEWRMKLLDGLKEGLFKVKDGMNSDEKLLAKQEDLLAPIVPGLVQEHQELEQEHANLQSRAEELANCDQEELRRAREKLAATNSDIDAKRTRLSKLQQQAAEKEARIANLSEQKAALIDNIKEAEKVREECRGWSSQEVMVLKERADALERKYGWTITSCAGTTVAMSFHREIEITFDMASFLPNDGAGLPKKAHNSPFDIAYIGNRDEYKPSPYTVEKQFFVQRIQMQLQGLQQGAIKVKDLLASVGRSWSKARAVTEEIRLLNLQCYTEAMVTSERCLSVTSTLLLASKQTKVEVVLDVATSAEEASVSVKVRPTASVVYGQRFNEGKMGEYLAARINGSLTGEENEGKGGWSKAITLLMDKLAAQGEAA